MYISAFESILIILICGIVTFSERMLPFLIFRKNQIPHIVKFLGDVLPMAVMITLVIYCVRNIDITTIKGSVPIILAVGVTGILQFWKKNTMISIFLGTGLYMILLKIL